MATLEEFRRQNPAYADVPDDELADGLYNTYYAGKMPREQFDEMVGYAPSPQRRYDDAMATVRQNQFPDMSDEQWEQYSQRVFAPDLMAQSQQSGSLGLVDEIGAAMGALGSQLRQWTGGGGPGFGETYDDLYELEQARLELARQNNGMAGTAVEIATGLGAFGPARTAAGQIPALLIGPTQPAVQSSRIAQAAQTLVPAATVGGVYGFGATDGDLAERAVGAGVGAGISALGATIAQPVGRAVEAVTRKAAGIPAWLQNRAAVSQAIKSAPTASTIKAGSKAAYKAAEDSGALITPKAMGQLRQNIMKTLSAEGLVLPSGALTEAYPKVTAAVRALQEFSAGDTSIAQAQTLLKTLRRIQKSTDTDEARIGTELVNQLEEFMDKLPPSAFSTGDGMLAAQQWAKGRAEWARAKRVGTIEQAISNAGIAKGGFAEGLKSEFRSILKSPKKQRGFTSDELAQMRAYVEGGPFPNFVSSFGSGSSFPAAVAGHFTGIPGGGAVFGATRMAAGAGARRMTNTGARRAAERLRATAATPGGLPQLPPPAPPANLDGLGVAGALALNPGAAPVRDEIVRLLIQE